MNNSLDFKPKEYEKMSHLESFVKEDKTIAQYKPHVWSNKQYITFRLKKDKKKGKYYAPIFKSTNLDAALFVYNNLHIMDVMSVKRQKELIKLESKNGENVTKVFVLEADYDELGNKRLEIAKSKDLNAKIIKVLDPDELCLE